MKLKQFFLGLISSLGFTGSVCAEPCGAYVQTLFTGTFHYGETGAGATEASVSFSVAYSRGGSVSARVGVQSGIRPETIWSGGGAKNDVFEILQRRNGGGEAMSFEGRFNMVFPENPDRSRADATTLTIHRDGRVVVTLNRWNDAELPLQELSCFRGSGAGSFLMRGFYREGHGGRGIVTMSISPSYQRLSN